VSESGVGQQTNRIDVFVISYVEEI